MSLYGDSYTVKGYALVNLDDKTIVGTGLLDTEKSDVNALNAAVENYIAALKDKNKVDVNANADDYKVTDDNTSVTDTVNDDVKTVTGVVTDVKTAVNNGNTVYYLQIENKYYYISVNECMNVLLVSAGDTVTVTYTTDSETFVKATNVEK